jgi:hypothetical protein
MSAKIMGLELAQVFGLWDFNNYIVTPFGLITMPILRKWKEAQSS